MRRTGTSKTCVWRWQERFAETGVDGLLRDKTRPSRIPPLGPKVIERVVALTPTDPPGETTHWTAALMAKATGVSVSSVQRIWRAHGLRPHRVRQFKLSNASSCGMRRGIDFAVSDGDRQRLEAIVADRNTPQKHVWRARIVLLSSDGLGTNAIMAATGTSKTTVWRWQARFMQAGVGGLLRDKTRPPASRRSRMTGSPRWCG